MSDIPLFSPLRLRFRRLVIGYFKKLKESMAVKEELPECVRGMVGIIPAGERDSVEEYHDYLMEHYA